MPQSRARAYPCDNSSHEAIASWFLGPKAENYLFMQEAFDRIVKDLRQARLDFHPEDGEYITAEVQQSPAFQNSMEKLDSLLRKLSGYMSEHNIPFYSPRYAAHMCSDTTLPGILGYLLTMMYNPNNVAPEASPLTSLIEYEVGQDLCEMLGYARQPVTGPRDNTLDPNADPLAWGHITCDGSVANLESIWVARNLKFYPLSLKNAMAPGAPFHWIAPTLKVPLCTGEEKLFNDCEIWELLNLTADAVLDLAPRLTVEYGLSTDFVQKVMSDYIIQTVSKDSLLSQYGIENVPQYFVATTKHYSWPKGAAIAGIGSENLIEVGIDNHARMDPNYLEQLLEERLQRKQAVYAVVAIIGSTEHGSVDPIERVVALREKFQKRGLSFLIHADAAWGGYFTSLLCEIPDNRSRRDGFDPYVPKMTLLPHTKTQLEHIKYADSITIDPHKSGYVPYPAGALCYRDERMRFLVTWTSPYIDYQQEGVQTMGTYGLEGSKPGAAPVAAWLSHEVIGLHKGGYGSLLGEAMFTGVKMYCHWATMSTETSDLILMPLNMLPSEQKLHATTADVEEEKTFIRERILNRPNRELVADEEAMQRVQLLGSDLMINAFACNFRVNGVTNTSVTEANILNTRIYETLSVLKVADAVKGRDIFVMSTVFSQKKYGECLTNLKRRLGLEGDEDLFALSNVSMSPFPTAGNFVAELAQAFQEAALSIIKNTCIPRNVVTPATHSFVMQGTDKVHLVYLPMFQMATYRQQLIIAVDLPPAALERYAKAQKQNPEAVFCLHTETNELLSDILERGSFRAVVQEGLPDSHASISRGSRHLVEGVEVTNIRVIKHRSLDPRLLESSYPEQMPFYLYGTTQQQHIDHILLSSPNVQLSSSDVDLQFDKEQDLYGPGLERELELGLVAVFDDVREAAIQPFNKSHQPTFFAPGKTYHVTIHRDSPRGPIAALNSSIFARGTITIGSSVFKDYDMINQDPTRIYDPTLSISAEALDEVETFVRGQTTKGEILASGKAPNIVSHGDCLVLDRFHAHNHQDDHGRTVAQRSAWKASWNTAVGRRY